MNKKWILLLLISMIILPHFCYSEDAYILPISGTIEKGLLPTVKRIIREAEKGEAEALIVEIETFGGDLESMVEIRDALVETDLQTIGYINKRAISAGALVALSCDHIVIAPGATIGAATPVYFSKSEGMKEANEKVVSYARTEFKSTAELKNHPVDIAEAMVDKDVEIPDPDNPDEFLITSGKLLTLSTKNALTVGLAEHEVNSISEILEIYDLSDSKVHKLTPNWSEKVARFLTSSAISGLLLTIGILALFIEFRTPTFGIAGTVGVIALALFFFGYYIYGLAGFEDVLLFVIGGILLALEIFVIPGFGVAGVLGLLCIFSSFVMSIIRFKPQSPFFIPNLTNAAGVVAGSMIVAIVIIIILAKLMPRTRAWSRMVLQSNVRSELPVYSSNIQGSKYIDKVGVTLNPLRPSGTALFGNERLDVVSEGGFVEEQKQVKIVAVKGNKIIVREV